MDTPWQESLNHRHHQREGLALLASLLSYAVFMGLAFMDDAKPYQRDNSRQNLSLQLTLAKHITNAEQPLPASPEKAAPAQKIKEQPKATIRKTTPRLARRQNLASKQNTHQIQRLDYRLPPLSWDKPTDNRAIIFNSRLQQQLNDPRIQRLNQKSEAKTAALISYKSNTGDEIIQMGDKCARVIEPIPGQKQWLMEACKPSNTRLFNNWKNGERIQ